MPILTLREKQIFDYLLQYYTTQEIALKLNISQKTVRNHISNVILKLNVKDRTQAVLELIRLQEIHLL